MIKTRPKKEALSTLIKEADKPETTAQDIIDWMKKFDQGRVKSFVVREVDEKP